MVEGHVLRVARAYVDHLRAAGIAVTGAIVHGPAAAGMTWGIGEIDLIVLSPDFGKDRLAEGRRLLRAAYATDPRIVPVPVHPDHWARADEAPFLYWAKKGGVEVPLD